MLLKLYIYGYLNRVQSSLRLEREARRNVDVIWLLVFPFWRARRARNNQLGSASTEGPSRSRRPRLLEENPYRSGWRPPGWGRFQLTGESDPTPDRID
ncbi:hypothetical protein J6525_41890 [Bradyrhizobium sp. WSM 4400]|nr:hypothetical protein [Bradyrhizobium australafricanum]